MFGSHPHSGGSVSPRLNGPVGAMIRFGPDFWRSLCLAMTLVVLASLAHGSSVTRTDPPAQVSVAALSAPSDDPCGSGQSAFHGHALCCSSAACPLFVPVDVVLELILDTRSKTIGNADVNFSSHAPPALFHPPKLILIA